MQREPPRKGGSAANATQFLFENKLEKEEEVLDAMLAAHARGQLAEGAWTNLHAAASRDERLSELAFAYESVSQGRRLKSVSAAIAADFLYSAATFFEGVFGDEVGATTYLERAVGVFPAHDTALADLEALLAKAKNFQRLGTLLVDVASHRQRPDQIAILKRAAEAFEGVSGTEEKLIELYQQLLRLDPTDEDSRGQLEVRLTKANRLRDVARLLEQALSIDPPPQAGAARAIHARLLELYANQLHEPERTIPHVEALLLSDPMHDEARRVALRLIVIKGLAARAASALANAASAAGTPHDESRFLQIELEHCRGPKRKDVLERIAKVRIEHLNDAAGGFEALEQALSIDATDEAMRNRFVELASTLGRPIDAAKTLNRLSPALKEPRARARVAAQMGALFFQGGDAKRARATLLAVLAIPEADAETLLTTGSKLSTIFRAERDLKALADVLEKLEKLGADPESTREDNEALADLATAAKDSPRALAALRRLLPTTARSRALAALEPIYEAAGDAAELAFVLEERARDAEAPVEARLLSFRAAEVRTTKANDAAAALAAWKSVVEKFGAARDVHAHMMPLLEAQRDWAGLAEALASEARLAPESERAVLLSRLGQVRSSKLRDPVGALDAFKKAIAIHPTDKEARTWLERMLTQADLAPSAAIALEPVARNERSANLLLRVLDAKAKFSEGGEDKLSALAEAFGVAETMPSERGHLFDRGARGLLESLTQRKPSEPWIARIAALAEARGEPKRAAECLLGALAPFEVDSDDRSLLAKRTGDACAACGDIAGAISSYRRALAFEPASTTLLNRVDELLKEDGAPEERIQLYRGAVESETVPAKRRDLLHRIGRIERFELKNLALSIETYRTIVEEDSNDALAYRALIDLYTETGQGRDVCALLEAKLRGVDESEARPLRVELARVAAHYGDVPRAEQQCEALLNLTQPTDEELGVVEEIASTLLDARIVRALLIKRIDLATDSRERIQLLLRKGELERDRAGDSDAAVAAWERAAKMAEDLRDDELARQLYSRIRKVVPDDLDATRKLAELSERAERWAALPPLFTVLLDHESSEEGRAALLVRSARIHADKLEMYDEASELLAQAFELTPSDRDLFASFERVSVLAGRAPAFIETLDRIGANETRALTNSTRLELLLGKARVLSRTADRTSAPFGVYKLILGDVDASREQVDIAARGIETLIGSAEGEERAAMRRWISEWKVERANETERAALLLSWAEHEEGLFGDLTIAAALYERSLRSDPENLEALAGKARVALQTGDIESALAALYARRERSEGTARIALELEIASVLLDRGARPEEALVLVEHVLDHTPAESAALVLAVRMIDVAKVAPRAIALLERACDSADDKGTRREILGRLLSIPKAPSATEERRGWYRALLDLHEEADDADAFLELLSRASGEFASDEALFERADRVARKWQRSEDVAEIYERALGLATEPEHVLLLGERAVSFFEEWFDDGARVIRTLERVLAVAPTAQWAFDRLKLIFDSQERWDELFALYDRTLLSVESSRRTELLEDAAQIAKDFAARPELAVRYLEELSSIRPGNPRIQSSLERLYEKLGRTRDLVVLLSARARSQSKPDAKKTHLRVASLWLTPLEDPASALSVLEEAMNDAHTLNADDPEALLLLERILHESTKHPETARGSVRPRDSSAPGGRRLSVRQRTALLLKSRYGESGHETDLARVLEIELETSRERSDQIAKHLELCELYEKLGRLEEAFEHAAALFQAEPHDDDNRARLELLGTPLGRQERVSQIASAVANDCDDDTLCASLLTFAGAVLLEVPSARSRALELFLQVIERERADSELLLSAAERALALLGESANVTEMERVLSKMAELQSGPSKIETLVRLGNLAQSHGDFATAIHAYCTIIQNDPEDAAALSSLVAIYEAESREQDLIGALLARAHAQKSDPKLRRVDLARAARLHSGRGNGAEAIALWRSIEDEFGESDEGLLSLALLNRAIEDWPALSEVFEKSAARAESNALRADYLRQLADVRAERLDRKADALEGYSEALACDPTNAGARAGLHQLLVEPELRARALAILIDVYTRTEQFRLVLELTPHRLSAADETAQKIVVLRSVAEIAERRVFEHATAFEALRRAFLLVPKDDAVESEFARLGEATGRHQAVADTYREALAILDREGERDSGDGGAAQLRGRLAQLLESKLDDDAGALALYKRLVVDHAEGSQLLAPHAIDLAAKLGDWDSAATLLAAGHALAESDPGPLVAAFENAVEQAGAWEAALLPLQTIIDRHPELSSRAKCSLEIAVARWQRDRHKSPDAAEAAFERALRHDEENSEILRELADLRRRSKGRPLVESLLRLSAATGGDLELLREAADVAKDAIVDRALFRTIVDQAYRLAEARAFGGSDGVTLGQVVDPASVLDWAARELATLLCDDGEPSRAVDLLTRTAAIDPRAPSSRELLKRAAVIAETRAHDDDSAMALYEQLFASADRDESIAHALAAIYERKGRTDKLLSVRDKQLASAGSAHERIALRLTIAALLARIGREPRAVEVLEENLREENTHAETVSALAELLAALNLGDKLRDLFREQAERASGAGDIDRAVAFLEQIAALSLKQNDRDAARIAHEKVVALRPTRDSFDALATFAFDAANYDAAAVYLRLLRDVSKTSESIDVTLRLSTVLELAGRGDDAIVELESFLGRQPGNQELRDKLADAYRARNDYRKLAELTRISAAHAPDKTSRLSRLRDAAELFRVQCNDPDAAIPLLEQASDLAPDEPSLKLLLSNALADAGRHADAKAIVRGILEGYGGRRPKERAAVHYHLANIELSLGNRAQALLEFDQATRIDPTNADTLLSLAKLAHDDGQYERAEKSYRALLAVLRRHEDGSGKPTLSRSEVLYELATLAKQAGDTERCQEILDSAREAATQSEFEYVGLRLALERRGDFETLAEVLAARTSETEPARPSLLISLAALYSDHLGRDGEALDLLLRCVAAAPEDEDVHRLACRSALKLNAAARYEEAVAKAIAGTESSSATRIHRAAGEALSEHEAELGRAAKHLAAAAEAEPTVTALAKLVELQAKLGSATELRDALGKLLALDDAPHGVRVDAMYKLSALELADGADANAGARILKQALALEPNPKLALDAIIPALRRDSTSLDLLELYDSLARATDSDELIVDSSCRIARRANFAREELQKAFETARTRNAAVIASTLLEEYVAKASANEADPESLSWALAELATLRAQIGRYAEAIELFGRAEAIAPPGERTQLLTAMATLAAGVANDLPLAMRTYERLMAESPRARSVWEALLSVYRTLGKTDEIADLLSRVIEWVESAEERNRLRLERVRILSSNSGPTDELIVTLRTIVEEDESQIEAASMLASMLEQTDKREELAQLLARLLSAAAARRDLIAIAQFALRLGDLKRAESPALAKQTYLLGLEHCPTDRSLLEATVGLLGADEDAQIRADFTERLLSQTDGARAEALALSLYDLRVELWDDVGAERALELGYRTFPKSFVIRERLESSYRTRSEHRKLAELFLVDAAARDDLAEKTGRIVEAARIYRDDIGDLGEACRVLRNAIALLPSDVTIALELVELLTRMENRNDAIEELSALITRVGEGDPRIAELFAKRGELHYEIENTTLALDDLSRAATLDGPAFAPRLALLLESLVTKASSDAESRELRSKLARVLRDSGQIDRARQLLVDLVRTDPKDRDALRTIADLDLALERWDGASATLRRLVPLEEGDALITTALALAHACEKAERLGDARGGLERARMIAPDNEVLRDRLSRVYEKLGAFHELAEMMLTDAARTGDVGERFENLKRGGDILLRRAEEPDAAVAPLREALALRKQDHECILLLADALIAAGRTVEAAEAIDSSIVEHKGRRSKELAALFHKRAHVARADGESQQELAYLTQSIDMDAQNGEVAAELATLAMDSGKLDLANRALRTITMLKSAGPMPKALAYQHMGEIARKEGDVKRAVMLLKRALTEDPNLLGAKALLDHLQKA